MQTIHRIVPVTTHSCSVLRIDGDADKLRVGSSFDVVFQLSKSLFDLYLRTHIKERIIQKRRSHIPTPQRFIFSVCSLPGSAAAG